MEKYRKLSDNEIKQIKQDADEWINSINKSRKHNLDYNLESVFELYRIIEELRLKRRFKKMIHSAGCFFAICIIKRYGGEWITPKIKFLPLISVGEDHLVCNPFYKVRQQFLNGSNDSIAVFFNSINAMQKRSGEIVKSSSNN